MMQTDDRRHAADSRRPRDNRSIGDLIAELSRETSTLVRQEIELAKVETKSLIRREIDLAKTEMTQKASTAGKNIGYIAAGGAIAYIGLMALAATVIVLLSLVMPLWLSSLIVGLAVVGIGYGLIQKGLTTLRETSFTLDRTVESLREDGMKPERTIETLKEDKQWAKDQVKKDRASEGQGMT